MTANRVTLAVAAIGACLATNTTNATADETLSAREGRWTTSTAEVLGDAAHIRLAQTGRTMKLLGLKPLEGDEAAMARKFLAYWINGKKVDCWWHPNAAKRGDQRAVTPDGAPRSWCTIRDVSYRRCRSLHCQLGIIAVRTGNGRFEGGVWETRAKVTPEHAAKLRELEANAKAAGIGLWSLNPQSE